MYIYIVNAKNFTNVAVYFSIFSIPNYFVFQNCDFTEKSYIKIRNLLIEKCKNIILSCITPLGGSCNVVHIVETVFKK